MVFFPLPLPSTLEEAIWLAIGITWGAAWGISDHSLMQTESVKKKSWVFQKLIGFLLDGTHHWWIGALIALYAPVPQLAWFGWGLFYDDWKDIPPRVMRFFKRE